MPRPSRAALLAAGVLFAALAVFGARVHWVEEAGSAERDGFVAQGEAILAGETPHDAFRPPLYPYAIAGLARVTGDAFVAARLLSNLCAATLALLAFAFARRLAAPMHADLAGAFAFLLVAVNPNTWLIGQHVTTDMAFAAFAGAALLAALAYLQRPRLATAVWAGLAYGAAAATRGNALLLLPGLLAAWFCGGRSSGSTGAPASNTAAPSSTQRAAHLLLAAGLAALVLAPHWLLRARVFGSPWYDENWKNLLWKLHGYPDWSKLAAIAPGGSFGQILRDEPSAVLGGAALEIWRFVTSGTAQLFGTWAHAVFVVVGAWQLLRPRRRDTLWLTGSAAVFVLGIATAFFTWGRFLLVLLPVGAALLAAGALAAGTRIARALGWVLLVPLVAVLAVKTAFFRVPAFVERHPYADVETLRRLERDLPRGTILAGTAPFLERYLAHPYFAIPDAYGEDLTEPAHYCARLTDQLRAKRVGFLVVGAADLRDRPKSLLDGHPAPPGLELAERSPRVTVWRVLPAR